MVVTALWVITRNAVNKNGKNNLIDPGFFSRSITQTMPAPTPSSAPASPQTFQFNSSTDLKMELNKVNPQVIDSDFN